MSGVAHYIAEAVAQYRIESGQVLLADLISGFETFERANDELRRLSGVWHFFKNQQALEEFQRALTYTGDLEVSSSREWGDFQTPPDLAARVCNYLAGIGVSPGVIIEPTCGMGNFIFAALRTFPAAERIYGVEIREEYVWRVKTALLVHALRGASVSAEIELHHDNIFTHKFPQSLANVHSVLVIGNPPWVTNAELGALGARNLPKKRNIKTLCGMDAITGKSNFDIGEFILLQMLACFGQQSGTLAMLCKDSVIKNMVELLPQKHFHVSNPRALKIDARREFGVAVEASLLVMELGAPVQAQTCQVATLEQPDHVAKSFGWTRGKFVSNVTDYEAHSDLDGRSTWIWRQGVKHDCAKIMELNLEENRLVNGYGEDVEVEGDHTYWLLKSSDLQNFQAARPRKKIIITQARLGDETAGLSIKAPRLWNYLLRHRHHFEKRKSSVYNGKPRFSIFGIGDYSFKLYKVAVSGLYKTPIFSLVLPLEGRPVMLDDTCYFLGFDTYTEALFTNSLLNSPLVIQFLRSIVFKDAKRPYTKEVLMRIDMARAAARLTFPSLRAFWSEIGGQPQEPVTAADWEDYVRKFSSESIQQRNCQLEFTLG